ncbi:hypothetical protein [Pseudoalteromonas luteoviolacea]|uniref:Uncharacterized protein n=1 Tax=Pseudoalteromonas luteoviolacea H33 TaxID=1365251 RepID=A0A167GB67_9GAMM|nr:hypothetical protein [Pseudoalteromonas luteoviolacea]KZN54843.1 hypothetical protein N476_07485 [Pseudoalteromonas luteoviolacea H33]KZN77075.1 hypothetical protein N477_13260 [Pseudoalteromonas luteoviolacea H33-S]MBQ4879768.1 hypothetical protein [Pseudoalteromonas luteoviolacea]MBQ4908830.1 hypothetical protein [Pseudoalteromonas luteoviolacea]
MKLQLKTKKIKNLDLQAIKPAQTNAVAGGGIASLNVCASRDYPCKPE